MFDFIAAFEFACKTARSVWRGYGAPVLPGPLDDGDLLAAAEEEVECFEPRIEKCIDCGEDFELGHYAQCRGPWWVERAVEAKEAKKEQCRHSYGDLNFDTAAETATCRCGVKFITKVYGHVSDAVSPFTAAIDLHAKIGPQSPVAMQGTVEDPSPDVPPASGEADSKPLGHLAQCLRDAVGDHYDFAAKDSVQFPFWHEDGLVDAFDWEGAARAFLEDVQHQRPRDFPCVVDGCPERLSSVEDLNSHSYWMHMEDDPFKVSGDPLVKYKRYPGATDGGDFTWKHVTVTSGKGRGVS